MVELAFRLYNNGSRLVAVAFSVNDGSAILRESHSLSGLGLSSTGTPDIPEKMPFGTWSIKREKDLVRGGLSVVIDYEGQRATITPQTRQGEEIEDYSVTYTFDGLSVKDTRTNPIQKAKSRAEFTASKDRPPLSDDTWP